MHVVVQYRTCIATIPWRLERRRSVGVVPPRLAFAVVGVRRSVLVPTFVVAVVPPFLWINEFLPNVSFLLPLPPFVSQPPSWKLIWTVEVVVVVGAFLSVDDRDAMLILVCLYYSYWYYY